MSDRRRMGDLETLILVSTALAGFGAVVQHFYDRYADNGLYKRTERRTHEIPAQIGIEVENALNRVTAAQERKYAEAAASAGMSDKMSLIRKVGVAKEEEKELLGMVAQGLAGPVVEGLRLTWPDMADKLEELLETDPARAIRLWEIAQRIPWVQKNILPRLKGVLGQPSETTISDNPFLKGMVP